MTIKKADDKCKGGGDMQGGEEQNTIQEIERDTTGKRAGDK